MMMMMVVVILISSLVGLWTYNPQLGVMDTLGRDNSDGERHRQDNDMQPDVLALGNL